GLCGLSSFRRRLRRHVGSGKARQHVIAHRELIDGGGHNDRRLLRVIFDDALIRVEIRVPRVEEILDRVLAHADPGQTGLRERSAVRAAETTALVGDGSGHAEVGKRRDRLAKNVSVFSGTENASAAHAPRARVNVKVTVELCELRLWFFESSEMLLYVGL